jgi:hypothetical protein
VLVQQHELRIESSFDWKLSQQSHAETMNGGDDCAVERALVSHPTHALRSGGGGQQTVQRFAQTLAHLVGSTIRKSDSDYLIDRGWFLLAQDVKVALNQNHGLARARSRRHGDVTIKRIRGPRLGWF